MLSIFVTLDVSQSRSMLKALLSSNMPLMEVTAAVSQFVISPLKSDACENMYAMSITFPVSHARS